MPGSDVATFSGGSLLAALLASCVNAVTSAVAVHFGVAAVVLLFLFACARTGLLGEEEATEEQRNEQKSRGGWSLPTRMTLWMCCAMVFGTVTEGAINDWSALYMTDVVKASAELAPLGIAVVSGMMVLARLFADGWRGRWGDGRVVVLGSALAGVGLALALLSGGVVPALIGFACVGLGIAAVTPCVYVAAARQGPEPRPWSPPWERRACRPVPRSSASWRTPAVWWGAWASWPLRRSWCPCAPRGSGGRPPTSDLAAARPPGLSARVRPRNRGAYGGRTMDA